MVILNTYSLVKEAYNDRGTDFMDRQPSNLSHFDLEDGKLKMNVNSYVFKCGNKPIFDNVLFIMCIF